MKTSAAWIAALAAAAALLAAGENAAAPLVLTGYCSGAACRASIYLERGLAVSGVSLAADGCSATYHAPGVLYLRPGVVELSAAAERASLVEGRHVTLLQGHASCPRLGEAGGRLAASYRAVLRPGYAFVAELPRLLCGKPGYLVVSTNATRPVVMKLYIGGSTLALEYRGLATPRGVVVPLVGQHACYTRLVVSPVSSAEGPAALHISLYLAKKAVRATLLASGARPVVFELPVLRGGEDAVGG